MITTGKTIGIMALMVLTTSCRTRTPSAEVRADADASGEYDIYRYVQECKAAMGISKDLPILSCLSGEEVPIYRDGERVTANNWHDLAANKRCDNPHWLGGDMGCWTYSHLQVIDLGGDNLMVVNCRQKGDQDTKQWYRDAKTNLGLSKEERKSAMLGAPPPEQHEAYNLYNTFNDLGIILRNMSTGHTCYITQYGESFSGFLPPLDRPLPPKEEFLNPFPADQARPPAGYPDSMWYRDARIAFRTPQFTANAGCIGCHNASGFVYSPYINSEHGLPDISEASDLPMLLVGEPFQENFRENNLHQISTGKVNGSKQLCTQCHRFTDGAMCGSHLNYATGIPSDVLKSWLTNPGEHWMPPGADPEDVMAARPHVEALGCCCQKPNAIGCRRRRFGPTKEELPADFHHGGGWVEGTGPERCL